MKPSDGSGLRRPINHTAGPCPGKKSLGGIFAHAPSICSLTLDLLISTWAIIPHPYQTVNNKLASGKLVASGLKQHHVRLLVGFFFLKYLRCCFLNLVFFFVTSFIFSCIMAEGQTGFIEGAVIRLRFSPVYYGSLQHFQSLAFWNLQARRHSNSNPSLLEFQVGKLLDCPHRCLQLSTCMWVFQSGYCELKQTRDKRPHQNDFCWGNGWRRKHVYLRGPRSRFKFHSGVHSIEWDKTIGQGLQLGSFRAFFFLLLLLLVLFVIFEPEV